MERAVVVGVEVGRRASRHLREESDLSVELARDVVRVDLRGQRLRVARKAAPDEERGNPLGRRRVDRRGGRTASRQDEVEAERESPSAPRCFGDSRLRGGLQDHHGGGRHDAREVRLEDARVDPRRPAEVVGVDDQPLHGAGAPAAGASSASIASFTAPIAGSSASRRTRACGVSRRRATSASRLGTAANVPPERTTS